MDYKDTLNLPRTDFPMRADLVTREPQRLEKWQTDKLYEKIQVARAGAEKFVLHDGQPFANGDVHIGTAGNKIRKDFIVKYKTLRGYHAPYVPGWDCHGLPIEYKVMQRMRAEYVGASPNGTNVIEAMREAKDYPFKVDPLEGRRRCEEFARYNIFGWPDGEDGQM